MHLDIGFECFAGRGLSKCVLIILLGMLGGDDSLDIHLFVLMSFLYYGGFVVPMEGFAAKVELLLCLWMEYTKFP